MSMEILRPSYPLPEFLSRCMMGADAVPEASWLLTEVCLQPALLPLLVCLCQFFFQKQDVFPAHLGPTPTGFPSVSDRKESACSEGNLGSIPELGRSPGEGNGNSLQYSCLENSMDREAWRTIVHGVIESQT